MKETTPTAICKPCLIVVILKNSIKRHFENNLENFCQININDIKLFFSLWKCYCVNIGDTDIFRNKMSCCLHFTSK